MQNRTQPVEVTVTMKKRFLEQVRIIFGPLKWRVSLVLGLIVVSQTLSLVSPYIQGVILDNISQRIAMSQTYWLVALAGVILLVQHWAVQCTRELYEVDKIDYDIDASASDHTMNRMTSLSVGQHNMLHSGLKKSIVNRGQHSLTALVFMVVYEAAPTLSRALVMAIAMCWLSFAMGAIVLVSMILFTVLTLWMNHIFKGDLRKLEKMWNQESKFRDEIIQNMTHVLVNAQEKKARREADAKYQEAVFFARPVWKRFVLWAYWRSMVLIIARVAVMALGAHYVYSGRYTLGMMVVFWSWSGQALDGLWVIGHLYRQITKMWVSIRRYCEFLTLESDVKILPNPVLLDPIQGRIEVRNVWFAYDSRISFTPEDEEEEFKKPEKSKRSALEDVSLVIEPGETIALVGETGSGKTTLANMFVRASDPTKGQILVDGQDLRALDLQAFRSRVGYVEQHVPLFDRSMRENILYGLNGKAKDVTTEELERISKIAQISRFSHKLEKGFDTLIGERGIKLSGGERQRVGIARALIKGPAILIFDEATSSLDAGVEAEIRDAINEASKGRTTIIIAHRFSTIRYANRIIVMSEGRIVGQGKHAMLYKSCEPYRHLVDHQVAGVLDREE